jgi:hypothetical protein
MLLFHTLLLALISITPLILALPSAEASSSSTGTIVLHARHPKDYVPTPSSTLRPSTSGSAVRGNATGSSEHPEGGYNSDDSSSDYSSNDADSEGSSIHSESAHSSRSSSRRASGNPITRPPPPSAYTLMCHIPNNIVCSRYCQCDSTGQVACAIPGLSICTTRCTCARNRYFDPAHHAAMESLEARFRRGFSI